jgi:Flp pilus assembly protein TadD
MSEDKGINAALAYEGKGAALFKIGKDDDAVIAYDRAIELFPLEASGPTWYKKSIALKALGRTLEADAAFEKAKKLGYEG